jgi:hypothetical protein
VAGAIRDRDRSMLAAFLTFGPFAIFAWVMLDRFSVGRFSIGYAPMFAIFAADGLRRFGEWCTRRTPAAAVAGRPRRGALIVETVSAAVLIGSFIVYTFPALRVVRDEVAPSVLAARATVEHVNPATDQLFVGNTMSVFVDLLAPGMPYLRVIDDRAMPLAARDRAWLLAEITETRPEGYLFTRERGRLWNIARRHYFEIKLTPLHDRARYISGWYGPEVTDIHEWRWMKGRSVTLLPPVDRDEALLRMHFGVPRELMGQNPQITVTVNGRVVDQFRTGDGYVERDYHVRPAPGNLPNVLVLSIDRTVIPIRAQTGDDTRELGLRVRYLAWGPA